MLSRGRCTCLLLALAAPGVDGQAQAGGRRAGGGVNDRKEEIVEPWQARARPGGRAPTILVLTQLRRAREPDFRPAAPRPVKSPLGQGESGRREP